MCWDVQVTVHWWYSLLPEMEKNLLMRQNSWPPLRMPSTSTVDALRGMKLNHVHTPPRRPTDVFTSWPSLSNFILHTTLKKKKNGGNTHRTWYESRKPCVCACNSTPASPSCRLISPFNFCSHCVLMFPLQVGDVRGVWFSPDQTSRARGRHGAAGYLEDVSASLHQDPRSQGSQVSHTHRVTVHYSQGLIEVVSRSARRKTVELVRRAEHCGVSWITVHGRTPKQRAEPASMESIKLV